MASGGVRLVSWIVLLAAVLSTLLAAVSAIRVLSMAGVTDGLHYLLDEQEEVLMMAFGCWCIFAVLRYASAVLQAKASQCVTEMAHPDQFQP